MRRAGRIAVLVPIAALAVLPLAARPVPGEAGTQDQALIALHATLRTKHAACESPDNPVNARLPCFDFVTDWPTRRSCDLYVVVAHGNAAAGVASVSFAIEYSGGPVGASAMNDGAQLDVYSWTSCTSGPTEYVPDLSDPDTWPASGAGIRLTWDAATDCQTDVVTESQGVQAVAGAFYVYAYGQDELAVIPIGDDWIDCVFHGGECEMQVGDCSGERSDIQHEFGSYVRFSDGAVLQGCNPCLYSRTSTRPLSWSRLKTTYQ